MVIRLFEELKKNKKSNTLVWVNDLSPESKIKFHAELLNSALQAVTSNSWDKFGELLKKWEIKAAEESHSDSTET